MTGTGKIENVQGIIFDMDNTLLWSRIDFPAMKQEVFGFLADRRLLPEDFPVHEHTTSTLIQEAMSRGISPELNDRIWDIAAKHEVRGMEGAGLEPGVLELLTDLKGKFLLAVVTNNAHRAAVQALEETTILPFFDAVIGREQMEALKPSPSGFHEVLKRFGHIPPKNWLSVGDSWIDGKASIEAGIPFVSYRTSMEDMMKRGVNPSGRIEFICELTSYLR